MSVESQEKATSGRSQTRVDHAHKVAQYVSAPLAEVRVDAAVLAAVAGYDGSHLPEQLERHAQDLALRLQSQQKELDRREADFNARVAQLENEARTARLVQSEREIELRDREQSFQRKWVDLQRRLSDVSAAEQALKSEKNEDRLQQRTGLDEIRHSVQRWQRRIQELDESERQLQAQLADVTAEREQVAKVRAELYDMRERDQARLKSECQTARTGISRRMLALQHRSEQLEHRQFALKQLHADVLRMYREATELRLCTEELWGQLSQNVSPAALTQRLAELRRKLVDQFQLATQSLLEQKKELQLLIDRLAEHRGTIQQQRHEVQVWLGSQQSEIERQAARLVAREQELDRQQAEMAYLRDHWEQRRHAYEQEIRTLKRRLEAAA